MKKTLLIIGWVLLIIFGLIGTAAGIIDTLFKDVNLDAMGWAFSPYIIIASVIVIIFAGNKLVQK